MYELADTLTFSWINIWGVCIIITMLIPNIIYAIKFRGSNTRCRCCKSMYILEQVGRYGSMFLMAFNIGIAEFGFPSVNFFVVYAITNIILTIAYLFVWVLYFHKQNFWKSLTLAIIPSCIFLISGITLRHYLLISFAIIFTFSHIIITLKDSCNIDTEKL